jgi:hypothetical protein
MTEQIDPTKVLNARIFFLTVIVTIATVCSLGVAVLALPPEKFMMGIIAELVLIATIPITYHLSNQMLK